MPGERKGVGTACDRVCWTWDLFPLLAIRGASTPAAFPTSPPEQNGPGLCSRSDLLPRPGLQGTSVNREKLIPMPVIIVVINNAVRITIINNNNDGPPEGAPAASG